MTQTPQQRKANAKFARTEESKRGKPIELQKKPEKRNTKSPLSSTWIILLAFVVIGGLLFEVLRLFF
ncbi:hypothetical protein EJ06DRAFT_526091 [Trichodelitschia bisporula]|uniref:Stress-associated endoplasmic reticulum protein n=1 Tax=Trichodelitschia bisporula TaxID=703511 RepID=A0A6G1IBM0_9PEZI|nr:hypothetical protein EJ06DRAFT_526091 [Trichodelitschia bisporula]